MTALAVAEDKGEPGGQADEQPSPCMTAKGQPAIEMVVTAANTADGATLTLTAKNPADVAKVQRQAANMAKYLQDVCKAKEAAARKQAAAAAK